MDKIEKKLLEFIDFKDIPSLPEAAKVAISKSLSNKKSMGEIANTINQNPSLTLKILKIANSAYYLRNNKVSNIKDALILLGYKTIKSIILSITIKDIFKEKELSWFSYRNYWLHLLATAIISKELSRILKIGNEDELYDIGLLHDIGKAVFLISSEGEYKKVVDLISKEHISFNEAERNIFGLDHTDLASFLLRQWNMPAGLIKAVSMHHNYSFNSNKSPNSTLYIIALANILAHSFGYVTSNNEPPYRDINELSKRLGLLNDDIDNILVELNKEIKSYTEILDIPDKDIKGFYTIISEANKKLGEMYIENRHISSQMLGKKEVLQHFNELSYILLKENNIEILLKSASLKLVEAFSLKKCNIVFYIGDKKSIIAHTYNTTGSFDPENYDTDVNIIENKEQPYKKESEDIFHLKSLDGTEIGYITIIIGDNKANRSELRSFIEYIALTLSNFRLQLISRLRSEKLQITVKKLQNEIESREKSDKLNSLILKHSPYGIIIADEKGDVLLHNENAEELFSKNLNAMSLLKNLDSLDNKFKEIIKAAFSKNQSRDIALRKNGKTIYIHLKSSILKDISKIIFTMHDITDRKIKEALLSEKRKMETLGELAAGIAHNLRSPLAAAKGILELIKNDINKNEIRILRKKDNKEIEDKEINENLNIIASSIEKSFVIINSILELSKKDNKEKIRDERFLVEDVLNDAYSLLKPGFIEKEISFSSQLNCKQINGSKNMFSQIFINLFNNAIEATDRGGWIKANCYEDKEKVIIDISDNGRGIPKEDLNRIFEPFYSTSGEAMGRGIGLSITKKMVFAHGGNIRAIPGKEGGTTFRIIIPKDGINK